MSLFPGYRSRTRRVSTFRDTLTMTIKHAMGVHLNPHLLRHFAAWLFLQHHPGAYERVRRILGHRSLAVTVSTYTGLETDAAARQLDSVVLRERSASRLLAQQAFRSRRQPKRILSGRP